jgi:parallel beta-helix repeat protein
MEIVKKSHTMKTSHIQHHAGIIVSLFMILAAYPINVAAQPSGGPYGPVRQSYDVPKVQATVYYVAPDGKAADQGVSANKPTTIETAIEKAKTGDVIILRGGIYRTGNLILNQGVTIQPYLDEQPVLKGTYIATEWKDQGNGLWTTKWSHLFPAKPLDWWNRSKYGKETPLQKFNNDMVFINGRFLQSVSEINEVNENTFFIDYESGLVYIGTDPKDKLVEITAFDVAIHRVTGECHGRASDKKGFILKGITLTQYAYRAIEVDGTEPEAISAEADHGKQVVGTVIENCSITYCSRVAAYLRGDGLVIRACRISDTSTEGIYIIASNDVLLEKNIFTRNNIEHITGYYPAAVKIFNQSHRVTCRDNLVTDLPESNGIWYDVGNVDGVFINNWVENVGDGSIRFNNKKTWPSENGFFFEISKNVICAGNVFLNCDQGIHILNSTGARVYNNTFINSTATFGRNERTPETDGMFGWHSGTGPDVDKRTGHIFVNNLLVDFGSHNRPLLFIWQPDRFFERNYKPQLAQMDNNCFVRISGDNTNPLIFRTQTTANESQESFTSLKGLSDICPECGTANHYYPDAGVFKSMDLKNFELLKSFPGIKDGVALPADIDRLLNNGKKTVPYTGAYPPVL